MISTRLNGKIALVTGGAKRIGRAVSLALAEAGAEVVICYRTSASEAETLADDIGSLGSKAWLIRADLSNTDEVEKLIDETVRKAGKLDILVNNASVFPKSDIDTVEYNQVIESISVDAWAPFALGRRMKQIVGSGDIINFVDSRIHNGADWSHFAYSIAKNMILYLTGLMATGFAPDMRVNAIAPGLILPPEGKDESYLESLKCELPLKMVGSPVDVSDAVLYLLSGQFITGQIIYVDGGRHLN